MIGLLNKKMREESYNTPAIVLKRQDYREYDSLVSFYTRRFGKVSLIARGTKKISSKLAGHIEPLDLVDLLVIKGRGRDYVGSSLSREDFLQIKSDLNKIYYAGAALRLFDRFTEENEPDEALFLLLASYLAILEDWPADILPKESGELLFAFLTIKLLSISGYRPETENCLTCHNRLQPGRNYFNLKNGGIVCPNCLSLDEQSVRQELLIISDNCVKLLRFMLQNDFSAAPKLNLDKKLVKEISLLAKNYLGYRD